MKYEKLIYGLTSILVIVGIEKMIPKDAKNQAKNKEVLMSVLINQFAELKKR